jgi:hypothetical protein
LVAAPSIKFNSEETPMPEVTPAGAIAEHAETSANRLPIIAASINDHLAAAEQATRRGLEHAIAAGLLLIEAKEITGHGKWLAWLEGNCRVGVRQAQTFMRLARNRHKVEAMNTQSNAYLTIATAAEALVGRPRPERPHGLPRQLDLAGLDWEVTAPAAIANPISERARLTRHIAELEYALAVIRAAQRMTFRGSKLKHRRFLENPYASLATTAAVIQSSIAFLRELRLRGAAGPTLAPRSR